MPRRNMLAVVFVAMAGSSLTGVVEAESPLEITSLKVADEDGQAGGRRCRRPLVHRGNERVFALVVMQNMTGETQPFSVGCKLDGVERCWWSGTIDPISSQYSKILLPSSLSAPLQPGIHTVVASVCASAVPCGASESDDVLDEVTVQFRVHE
jgi:hypothetical protein